MGGFQNLKAEFDRYLEKVNPEQNPVQYLTLRTWFEINGNLDSLELTARAILEQLEIMNRNHLTAAAVKKVKK